MPLNYLLLLIALFFWYSKCIHLDLSTLEFIYLYLGFVWYSHSSLSPSSLLEERFIYGTVYLKIKPSNIHLKTMFFSMNSILLKSLVAQATCIGQKKKKVFVENVISKRTRTIITSALYCDRRMYSDNGLHQLMEC